MPAHDNKAVASSHLLNFYNTIGLFMNAYGLFRVRIANLESGGANPKQEVQDAVMASKNDLLFSITMIHPFYESFSNKGIIKKDSAYDGLHREFSVINPDNHVLLDSAEKLATLLYSTLAEDIIANLLDSAQEYMSQVYAKPVVAPQAQEQNAR